MTFPTEDEMLIHDESGEGDYVLVMFPEDALNSKEDCENLKSQIIAEHEIVERLKEEIKLSMRVIAEYPYIITHEQIIYNLLLKIYEGKKWKK